MNTTQSNIDSINACIAKIERELEAEKSHAEQVRIGRIKRIYRDREALESTLTYKGIACLRFFISAFCKMLSTCFISLAKIALVTFALLSPIIIAGIIVYYT